jgi:NADH-quinone oxidoreductase subunit J
MTLDAVIFIISAVVAVFGAIMMISLRNPVLSVLSLIVSLVAQAVLYIQLGALFLGAVLIIVYSGAILVLFLFVIMLLNLRGSEDLGQHSSPSRLFAKFLLSLLLVVELVFVIKASFFPSDAAVGIMSAPTNGFGSVETVATLLFTKYLYPFELTSILLLAAIVGAVVMARQDNHADLPNSDPRSAEPDSRFTEEIKK